MNVPVSGSDYLGWESSVLFPLDINHKGEYPIIFSTTNQERMRLTDKGNLLIGLTSSTSGARLEIAATQVNIGLRSHSAGANTNNFGGWFSANNASINYAVHGTALSSTAGANYGVAGEACNGNENYAVYGEACLTPNSWAGYFNGKTYTPGAAWSASDANLKTDVQDLVGATDMLMALEPKSYVFDQSVEQLNLPEGLQYGLLAQNLETVIPHAVMEITTPAKRDEAGNILAEPLTFKGVNNQQLIPLLIAGFKEQNNSFAANEAKMNTLIDRLENTEMALQEFSTDQFESENNSRLMLEQNAPNPFQSHTTITFRLDKSAQVHIDIRNRHGELVEVLKDGHVETGEYKLEWNTKNIPNGMYICTMTVNGEAVSRKMVKL